MDTEKQILEDYIKGSRTGSDNQLRAAIGSLNAKSTEELSKAVSNLHQQIPTTISKLRNNLSQQTDKMIETNKRIADSNSKYAKALNTFTFVLAIATIALVVVGFLQYLTIRQSTENQINRWKMEDWQKAVDDNSCK